MGGGGLSHAKLKILRNFGTLYRVSLARFCTKFSGFLGGFFMI